MNDVLTIPVSVAAAFVSFGRPASRVPDDLGEFGVTVGAVAEIDVAALACGGYSDLAEDLVVWFDSCRAFWGRHRDSEPTGPWVAAKRALVDVSQRDTAAGRVYLTEEMSALGALPGWGELIDAVTCETPDWGACERLAAALGADVVRDGVEATVRWADVADRPFDVVLGGVGGPGEFTRWFDVVVRHASWRDRPARRLHRVRVEAEELWPLRGGREGN